MNGLKIRVESKKIPKGKLLDKKITDKDINTMKIDQIIQTINILVEKIEKNDLSYYNVNTFMILCGKVIISFNFKAVEHFSAIGDPNHIEYLLLMKRIINKEDVQKIVNGDDSK